MNDVRTQNHRNGHPIDVSAEVPSVQTSNKQRLVAVIDNNTSLQQVLATVSTPASKLLKVISRSLGRAEAEIEFTERIRVREE